MDLLDKLGLIRGEIELGRAKSKLRKWKKETKGRTSYETEVNRYLLPKEIVDAFLAEAIYS